MADLTDADKGRQRVFVEDSELEKVRLEKFLIFSILGIACLTLIILVLNASQRTADEIVSISGVLTGLLGVLAGLFGGIEVGSEGKRTYQKQAARNKARYELLLAKSSQVTQDTFYSEYYRLYEPPQKS